MQLGGEREALAWYARHLIADGLAVGTAGNLSIRVGELVAITPSAVPYEKVTPELCAVVKLDGEVIEAETEPSLELRLHLAVYGGTAAGAVVHTHPAFATAVGAVFDELPGVHYLVAELGGPVRVVAYAQPGSANLAEGVVTALTGRSAALLRNHGAVTIGESLERAYERAVLLEWLCAIWVRATALGDPAVIAPEDLTRLADLVSAYGRR
jgi:L-fuculose-phosphate aldolase